MYWRKIMKTDSYTKVVLTVIAVCLLVIAGQGIIPDAIAASNYSCNGTLIGSILNFTCFG